MIQIGAIAAVLLYLPQGHLEDRLDVGTRYHQRRGARRLRLPDGLVRDRRIDPGRRRRLLGESLVTGAFRNLWWVASALIVWSIFMVLAEKVGTQDRGEKQITMRDSIIMGLVQVVSLVPGVSRSGATIAAGLFVGLDRVAATRMAFFLSIPALTGAGIYELPSALGGDISVTNTVVATVVSFVVAYVAVAWLLKFVAHHSIVWFVGYRLAVGAILLGLLATGTITADLRPTRPQSQPDFLKAR